MTIDDLSKKCNFIGEDVFSDVLSIDDKDFGFDEISKSYTFQNKTHKFIVYLNIRKERNE